MHLKHPHTIKRKWIYPLVLGSTISLFLLFILTLTSNNRIYGYYSDSVTKDSVFIEDKLHPIKISNTHHLPRFAYLISGSNHDGVMLKRTLLALYHPNNRYVVHLDAESDTHERNELFQFVKSYPIFMRFGNVVMITKANLVTYRGPTMVANTLHAAAILLKEGAEWDWFINLSASDYPLVTQDG